MTTAYDRIGMTYSATRRPDPRIAARILDALGDAVSVLNVGAGAGSYEPRDRNVVAVEPSEVMIRQRPALLVQPFRGRGRRGWCGWGGRQEIAPCWVLKEQPVVLLEACAPRTGWDFSARHDLAPHTARVSGVWCGAWGCGLVVG